MIPTLNETGKSLDPQAGKPALPPTYKQALATAMQTLAADPLTRFVGYGLKPHGVGVQTFAGINPEQIIEMPVAENLLVGVAIGLALRGLRPLVFIERCDFILNALDAIVNHLDKMALLSRGEYRPALILRVVVGNTTKPLFTGVTHTQDFSEALRKMVGFPIIKLMRGDTEIIGDFYQDAALRQRSGMSTLLVEYKDLL